MLSWIRSGLIASHDSGVFEIDFFQEKTLPEKWKPGEGKNRVGNAENLFITHFSDQVFDDEPTVEWFKISIFHLNRTAGPLKTNHKYESYVTEFVR